jgi:DNA modification methylase
MGNGVMSRLYTNASASQIPLADKSVHCMVTSPPYYSLRKYAGEQQTDFPEIAYFPIWGMDPITIPTWRGALGLEPSFEMHIGHIVLVMRDVYRVLRDDGVAWLNYGDCYAGSGGEHKDGGGQSGLGVTGRGEKAGIPPKRTDSLEDGNLYMMPHRIALALQADGWIVRNDCVWWKPNPMPESAAGTRWQRKRKEAARISGGAKQVTNIGSQDFMGGKDKVEWEYLEGHDLRQGSWRHTRSHEYVFMLTKQMGYWSDQETVRESPSGRNPRTALKATTSRYKHAHYATYPPELIAPLVLATCPRKCCPVCGKGWSPVVDVGETTFNIAARDVIKERGDKKAHHKSWSLPRPEVLENYDTSAENVGQRQVSGYAPTCNCGRDDHVPGVVLDPFVGSGTTLEVAKEIGLRGIGLDISYPYLRDQAMLRVEKTMPRNALDGLPMFEGIG